MCVYACVHMCELWGGQKEMAKYSVKRVESKSGGT